MMTHVKRNAQDKRGFIKPNYLECALNFLAETTDNCSFTKDHDASLKSKLSPEYELHNYLAKREKDSRLLSLRRIVKC